MLLRSPFQAEELGDPQTSPACEDQHKQLI